MISIAVILMTVAYPGAYFPSISGHAAAHVDGQKIDSEEEGVKLGSV